MDPEGLRWFEGLSATIARLEQQAPVPARASLSPLEEEQCRVIGGCLLTWLERHWPELIAQRAALLAIGSQDPRPFVVFTSHVPGFIAAREILHPRPDGIQFLVHETFLEWRRANPDPEYLWHVHY